MGTFFLWRTHKKQGSFWNSSLFCDDFDPQSQILLQENQCQEKLSTNMLPQRTSWPQDIPAIYFTYSPNCFDIILNKGWLFEKDSDHTVATYQKIFSTTFELVVTGLRQGQIGFLLHSLAVLWQNERLRSMSPFNCQPVVGTDSNSYSQTTFPIFCSMHTSVLQKICLKPSTLSFPDMPPQLILYICIYVLSIV